MLQKKKQKQNNDELLQKKKLASGWIEKQNRYTHTHTYIASKARTNRDI